MIDDKELIQKAKDVINPRRLSPTVEVGGVGSALVTDKGNVLRRRLHRHRQQPGFLRRTQRDRRHGHAR